jgi:hypothetical protein
MITNPFNDNDEEGEKEETESVITMGRGTECHK